MIFIAQQTNPALDLSPTVHLHVNYTTKDTFAPLGLQNSVLHVFLE